MFWEPLQNWAPQPPFCSWMRSSNNIVVCLLTVINYQGVYNKRCTCWATTLILLSVSLAIFIPPKVRPLLIRYGKYWPASNIGDARSHIDRKRGKIVYTRVDNKSKRIVGNLWYTQPQSVTLLSNLWHWSYKRPITRIMLLNMHNRRF